MNPVLVNVWRGSAIESLHRGAVAVVDASGNNLFTAGDIEQPIFPRSALKFLQTIPLIESGAADHFKLDDEHIAFACASHNGEGRHTVLAQHWLQAIGCSADDLECGAEMPLDKETTYELVARGGKPERFHHNCSGKHCGLLTAARFFSEKTEGYRLYDHEVQQRLFSVLENMTGLKIPQLPWGYDGCGIPNVALPLQATALAFARFANPSLLAGKRQNAIERIGDSVASNPYLIAGRNRLCTALIEITGRDVLIKTGAEGFYTAVLRKQGLGVALKIDDGSSRGSMVAMGAVLLKLGALTKEQYHELEDYVLPSLTNSRSEVIGRAEPSEVLQ